MSIKQLTRENPISVRRVGYGDMGFAFYFVRCRDRKTLGRYVTDHARGSGIKCGEEPYGYYFTNAVTALEGMLPEAHDSLLVEVYMVVAADERDHELRHWRHEIGHAVAAMPGLVEFVFPQQAVPGHEAAAYLNEYLLGCLDSFLAGTTEPTESGLPLAFPWLCKAKDEANG